MSFKDAYRSLNIENDSPFEILHMLQKVTSNNNILYTFIEQVTNYLKAISFNENLKVGEKAEFKRKIIDLIDKAYAILLKQLISKKSDTISYTLNEGEKLTRIDKKTKKWKNFNKGALRYLDKGRYDENEPECSVIYDLIDLELALHSINGNKDELSKNEKLEVAENVYKFIMNFNAILISSTSEPVSDYIDNSEEWYSANELSNPLQTTQEYFDTNNSTYCYCNGPYVGKMVGCDGENCSIEWFHFECVNLKEAPKDKWYCKECLAKEE